jgi:hypothetical protein
MEHYLNSISRRTPWKQFKYSMLACGKTNHEISHQPSALRKAPGAPPFPVSLGRVRILTSPHRSRFDKVNFPAPATALRAVSLNRSARSAAPPKGPDFTRTFFLFTIFFFAQHSIELKLDTRTHSARRCVVVLSGVCRIGNSGNIFAFGVAERF